MSSKPIAWVTRAPADYMLVFTEGADGEHAAVSARFPDPDRAMEASSAVEGAEVDGESVCVFCTLPGEEGRVRERLRDASALETRVDRGRVAFVAVGGGRGTSEEATRERRNVTARVVISEGGARPRCYRLMRQCPTCGEFVGAINVMPGGPVMTDTRELSCRCMSIPCRYCDEGTVRGPLTEHFDPERRAGRMPWFGYLVPCGGCQAAGRGPQVQMSV